MTPFPVMPKGAGDGLTDEDLRQHEVKLPSAPRRTGFVPAFPLTVLQVVVRGHAEKTLPLILAIHRQLQMSGREWTPLNAAVWEAAGNPTSKERATILRKLQQLPEVIRIEPKRTPVSYYKAARGALFGPPGLQVLVRSLK